MIIFSVSERNENRQLTLIVHTKYVLIIQTCAQDRSGKIIEDFGVAVIDINNKKYTRKASGRNLSFLVGKSNKKCHEKVG